MKILLCNIPFRPIPTEFPPVACLNLINFLKKNGYEASFYDLYLKRPSFDELTVFFKREQFDIVGISAVVSTGYKYTKSLSSLIKKVSPNTQIILGGNLAVSYKVILQKCKIDICVMGEGEKVLLNLVRYLDKHTHFKASYEELRNIKGIAFLNPRGECEFTEYAEPLTVDEIGQVDYELLERLSDINHYIFDPSSRIDFDFDPRSHLPHQKNKKMAAILTSKGCVNRCSFCHRWVKGYRILPVEKVIATMEQLKEKYNVGFFAISDECFGESQLWLEKFIKLVKPLDILLLIGGARVAMVKKDPTIIQRLKEVGLTAIYFGMESGSDKILKIMEKNVTAADNLEAAKLCAEARVYTAIQLVIGLPGENEETINETIEFVKKATGYFTYPPQLSVNYVLTLPGAPCYAFLQKNGLIGKSIDDEEKYLLNVSDMEAADFKQYVNASEEPLSKVSLWKHKIYFSARIYWIKRHGYDTWLNSIKFNIPFGTNPNKEKSFKNNIVTKIKFFIFNNKEIKYEYINFMEKFFWDFLLFKKRISLYNIKRTFLITFGIIEEDKDREKFKIDALPIRKILQS